MVDGGATRGVCTAESILTALYPRPADVTTKAAPGTAWGLEGDAERSHGQRLAAPPFGPNTGAYRRHGYGHIPGWALPLVLEAERRRASYERAFAASNGASIVEEMRWLTRSLVSRVGGVVRRVRPG